MPRRKENLFKSFLSSASAAGLLILAFPKTDIWPLAWVGLVPLLRSLDGQRPLRAFGRAYLCGVLFFGGTLYWIIHVTLPGMLLLVAYLAVYFGLFGAGYNFLARRATALKPFVLASFWTLLEFLRAHFLTGFGWAGLGYAQYKNLPLIQIADITGVYGVSFLVVLINCFFKEILEIVLARKRFDKTTLNSQLCILLIVLGLVAGYGIFRLALKPGGESSSAPKAVIAVVQGDIPQTMKWYEPAWPDIMARYKMLTEAAVREKPDLIIWPETSFPGILWEDKKSFDELRAFVARTGIPLLVGSIVSEGGRYYNTAILLSKDGKVLQQYRKIHLVPFGEYIPLRFLFPFLEQIVPIADFTAGEKYTVFDSFDGSRDTGKSFSVLICFEDTVEGLPRQFVGRGAGLLVNITNDAWFHDTKAPFMHLQGSVFRAVENRRAMVRAANTGVSGFVDSAGRLAQVVADERGKKTYVPGYALAKVPFHRQQTFYTRYGDVFVLLCLGCLCVVIADHKRKRFQP